MKAIHLIKKLAKRFELKLAAKTTTCIKCGYDNPYMDPVDDYICRQCKSRNKAWGDEAKAPSPVIPTASSNISPLDFFKKLKANFGGHLIEDLHGGPRVNGVPTGGLSRIEWEPPHNINFNDVLDFARKELGHEHIYKDGLGHQWSVNAIDPNKSVRGYPIEDPNSWWLRVLNGKKIIVYSKFVLQDFK